MRAIEIVFNKAWQRGYDRGLADKNQGYVADGPLSGEWAGESINELLGDLITTALNATPDWLDEEQIIDEICTEYEGGYFEANDIERAYE